MLNQTPIDWFGKHQNQVETATCGSEFVVARIGCERLIDLRCALRSFGVPLDGPSWMFGDNKSVVASSTIPHSRLSKRWNALSHHRVREAIAGGWLRFEHVPGTENPADVLTEPPPWFTLKTCVEPLLMWKGDTVDAPPGDPNPEGSDTGPGRGTSRVVSQSRVVEPNHGRDSTGARGGASFENRSAGVPIPAALPGNQHGVLCEEDDWFQQLIVREQFFVTERKLTIFSFVKLALVCLVESHCVLVGKGLITPATLTTLQWFDMHPRWEGTDHPCHAGDAAAVCQIGSCEHCTACRDVKPLQRRQCGRGDQSLPNEDTTGFI